MNKQSFSVAMSVYKNDVAEHFDKAIESITDLQTIKPDEIILIVDGPVSERLNDVIAKHERKCDTMKVIRLQNNGGLGNAMKIAVEQAKYELIARMDSDDIALPTRFEEQLRYFAYDSVIDIVGGDISEFVDAEENIVAYRRVPHTDAEIKEYLKHRCPMNHMSVMFKKTAVQNAGGYIDLFWNEDYYLWIRMAEHGATMANTGTVLVNVRTGSDMYSRRGGKRYFQSEKFLQQYMLHHKIIGVGTYMANIAKRLIVQVLLPNRIRGWVFRTFARQVV